MKKLFVRALSLVIILTLLISCFSVSAFASKGVSPNNWMSAVKSSTPITAINIPGTHDTATQYVTASYFSQTQSLSIKEQLDIGVRYFDIRLEKTENDFIAVHGITDCKEDSGVLAKNLTAGKIIEYCRDFLKSNPTETILFQIKEDDGDAGTAFFDSFYDLYIKDSRSLWFTENRIPTLGEVREKLFCSVLSAPTQIILMTATAE